MKISLIIRAFWRIKTGKRYLQHFFLLLSLWLVAGSVHAYISEIATEEVSLGHLNTKLQLRDGGYTFVCAGDGSTNINVSNLFSSVFIGYKTTAVADNAITGLLIYEQDVESFTYDGCTYYKCKAYTSDGVLNPNTNCVNRYLYYTKDKQDINGAITSLGFDVLSGAKSSFCYVKGYDRKGNIKDSQNLYQGSGQATYVYISFVKEYDNSAIKPFELQQKVTYWYNKNGVGTNQTKSYNDLLSANKSFADYYMYSEKSLDVFGWNKESGSDNNYDYIWSIYEAKMKVPAYCALSFTADVDIWGASSNHHFNATVYHTPDWKSENDVRKAQFPLHPYFFQNNKKQFAKYQNALEYYSTDGKWREKKDNNLFVFENIDKPKENVVPYYMVLNWSMSYGGSGNTWVGFKLTNATYDSPVYTYYFKLVYHSNCTPADYKATSFVHSTQIEKNDIFRRDGYSMKEWNTKADGTGESFAPGQTITASEKMCGPVRLYAIWSKKIATNVSSGKTYYSLQEAVDGANENDSIVVLDNDDDLCVANKPLRINLNGKTVSGMSYTHDTGVSYLYNGTVTNPINGDTDTNVHNAKLVINAVTVTSNVAVYVKGYDMYLTSGKFNHVINNKTLYGNHGTLHISGRETFVGSIRCDVTDEKYFDIRGGFFRFDPTVREDLTVDGKIVDCNGITLPEGYTVIKLAKAPADAPLASYRYEVVKAGGNATNVTKDENKQYSDIALAFEDADEGDVIRLDGNVDEVEVLKAVELDLAGKKIEKFHVNHASGNLIIRNGVVGTIITYSPKGVTQGSVTLDNVDVIGYIDAKEYNYTIKSGVIGSVIVGENANAHVNVTGSDAYVKAFDVQPNTVTLMGGHYLQDPSTITNMSNAVAIGFYKNRTYPDNDWYKVENEETNNPDCYYWWVSAKPFAQEGTSEDPFLVGTADDLLRFSAFVNGGNSNACIRLTADIDLANKNWMPIGVAYSDGNNINVGYNGTIDGDGYVISNMTVADDIAYVEAGLVGRSSSAKIKNLIINNVKLTNKYLSHSAPFIGNITGLNTEFRNCASIGNIKVQSSGSVPAGFANLNHQTSSFYNCYTAASALCTNEGTKIISNVYWGDDVKNWAESGELCYKVNGNNGTLMPWKQTIGVDPYPVLRGNNLVAYSASKIDGTSYFNIKTHQDDANHIISNSRKPIELGVAPTSKTTIKAHVRLNKINSGMNFILGSMKDETGSTSVADAYNAFGIGVDGTDNSFVCATGSRFVHSDSRMAKVGQDYYVTLANGYVRIDTVENASADYYHHDLVMYQFNNNDTKIKIGELAGCNYEPTYADINVYKVEVYEDGLLQNQYIPGRKVASIQEGMSNWLFDAKNKTYLSMSNKTLDAEIALCHDGHMAYTLEGKGKNLVRRCVICGESYPVTEPFVNNDLNIVPPGAKSCVAWTDSVLNLRYYTFEYELEGQHYVPVIACDKYYIYNVEADTYKGVYNVSDSNLDIKSAHDYEEWDVGDYIYMSCKICGHVEVNYIEFKDVLSVTIGEDGATTHVNSSNAAGISGKTKFKDSKAYSCFYVKKGDKLLHYYQASIYNGVPCFFDPITYDVVVCNLKSGYPMDESLAHVSKCVNHRWLDKVATTDNGKKYRRCMICNELVEDTRSYIRTNKTSYLNTEMNTTKNTVMKIDFALMKEANLYDVFFGAKDFYVGCSTDNTYKVGDLKTDINLLPLAQNQYLSLSSDKLSLYYDSEFSKMYDYTSFASVSGSTVKVGTLDVDMKNSTDICIYGFDINEGDKVYAHFVPSKRGKQLGFFETEGQKFYPMSGRGATGEIYPCEKHEYWDYETDTVMCNGSKQVSWHKHCRVCDESFVIDSSYRFITNNGHSNFTIDYTAGKFTHYKVKYNNSDDFTPSANIKTVFADGKNEDINEFVILEGTNVVRDYFPSLWNGVPCLYESVNDTHIYPTSNQSNNRVGVASVYVPQCSYHNYYDLEKKTINGVVYYSKHCKICDTHIYLNGMSVESKDVLNKYMYKEDGVHTMYIPIQTKGAEYKHIGTEYPNISDKDLIFEHAVMLEGKLINYFKPSVYGQKSGVYDVVKNEFIEIPGSKVYINQCEHPYQTIDYKDGEILRHCYICDDAEAVGHYLYIKYNANGGYGEGYAQMVTTDKDVAVDCTFTNGAHFFGGWKMTDKKGNEIDKLYKAGDAIGKPSAELCDTVVFNAQWEDGFVVNGQAPQKVDDENTQEITIIDDGKNGYEATGDFMAQKVNFKRCLDEDYKKEWGTLCIPFSAKSIEGKIQFFAVKSVADDNSSISPAYKITLEKLDASVAGVPCIYQILDRSIIVDDTLTITSQSYDGVLMKATTEDGSNADVRLKGTYKYYSFLCEENSNYYVISRNSFWRSQSALTMRPYHAYIYHEKTAFTPARNFMYLVLEGDPTDIMDITSTDEEVHSVWTVDGIAVKNMTPGNIYIVKYKSGKVKKIRRTHP